MKENLPYLFSAVSILLAIVSIAYTRRRDSAADFTKLSDKVDGAIARLIVVETKAEIFFRGMSVSSAAALHSPHTKELDTLLEKFQRDEIQSEKELGKLKEMLKDVADNDPEPMRKKFALDILTLIHVRFEIGGDLIESFRQT